MDSSRLNGQKQLSFPWVVATTSLAFVVSQLDVSIVNIALPQIAKSLNANISTLQWIIDAYTLAFAVLMLSAGSLSDILGSKMIFQLGIILFAGASIGCGLSGSSVMLILFRAIQGIGAAAMIPSSLSILNQAFSDDQVKRARAVALWTAAGSVAIAAGPIFGGLLIKISNWRSIFFVNVPICLIGILMSFRLTSNKRQPGQGLDIPGQTTWTLALAALIAVIIECHSIGFKNALIIGGFVFSIVMMIWFIRIEKKASHAMLPLTLFKSSSFNVLLLLGTVLNNAYYGTVFVLSLYLQNVLRYPPLTAGLAFLPLTAGFICSNLLSSKMIEKFGMRTPILIGLCIFVLGFTGLTFAKATTPYWQLLIPFFIIPMGMGLAVPAMTNGILSSVDKDISGTASAVLNTTRQAAGAIGVAIFGAMANGGAAAIVHAITVSSLLSIGTSLCIAALIFKYLKTQA